MISKILIGSLILLPLLLTRIDVAEGTSLQKATFAGGCFWCMEPPFEKLDGVKDVVSGYTRHHVNPTYEAVSGGGTGHLESLR
jgi:peptide methionine sulfoxide reductase MsrA